MFFPILCTVVGMTLMMPNDVLAGGASTQFSYTVEDTNDVVREGNDSEKQEITSVSKTGDRNNIMIYVIGIGISIMIITGVCYNKKK